MPIDFDEKRDFIRMAADHVLQYQLQDSNERHQGICLNLSATGILFRTDQSLSAGTRLNVNITPQYAVVSPFDATVEVIRSQPNGSEGQFEVAGRITSIS